MDVDQRWDSPRRKLIQEIADGQADKYVEAKKLIIATRNAMDQAKAAEALVRATWGLFAVAAVQAIILLLTLIQNWSA